MAWQPLQANPVDNERSERLIASGSDDCSIMIWNARNPDSKPKCFLTMESPIVALAFTPDGAFIAGATCNRVLIWKVGEHAMPRASWSRTPHPAWSSPRANGESDEEDEHCLCWDATGQKLAYGVNSRVSRPRCIVRSVVSNECCSLLSLISGSRTWATSATFIYRPSPPRILIGILNDERRARDAATSALVFWCLVYKSPGSREGRG